MRIGWKFLITCSVLGVLSATAGCGSDSSDAPEATPASIRGTTDEAGSASSTPGPGTTPRPVEPAADPLHPEVLIETSLGNIKVQLDGENASLTVNNFLGYVQSGYYDQTIFHQVFSDYVILGGGYGADLKEKEARLPIRNEARNGLKNLEGTIAMARQADVVDSATSQFFINVRDNPSLDHRESDQGQFNPEEYGYCVFGRVTEGLDVVRQIASVPVQNQGEFEAMPVQMVTIRSIRQIR